MKRWRQRHELAQVAGSLRELVDLLVADGCLFRASLDRYHLFIYPSFRLSLFVLHVTSL